VYETFNNLFSQKGSISFDKQQYVYSPYSAESPVLIVHKPTETSHELHGYYFPK